MNFRTNPRSQKTPSLLPGKTMLRKKLHAHSEVKIFYFNFLSLVQSKISECKDFTDLISLLREEVSSLKEVTLVFDEVENMINLMSK